MKSVFNAQLDINNKVNRNSYDWSKQNNLTLNMGGIYPCYCELVPPGSSIKVNPTFGLQFMPMVFPVQTRMRAQMSFYKVPIRTLWKDYRDFIGNFKTNLVPPFVNINSVTKLDKMVSTGSLGDYLNIPTTQIGAFGSYATAPLTGTDSTNAALLYQSDQSQVQTALAPFTYEAATPSLALGARPNWLSISVDNIYTSMALDAKNELTIKLQVENPNKIAAEKFYQNTYCAIYTENGAAPSVAALNTLYSDQANGILAYTFSGYSAPALIKHVAIFTRGYSSSSLQTGMVVYGTASELTRLAFRPIKFNYTSSVKNGVQDITLETSPYYNSASPKKMDQIMLSAYPFRAYEAVYNAYMRDNRNNPYILDGQVEYNKWIPSDAGGQDDILYSLHQKNWEQDFLTTAVQSPQQGIAPLVGITTYTSQMADGTPTSAISLTDESGKTYKVNFSGDNQGLSDVSYEELSEKESSTVSQPRSLFDLAQTGIAISDLRYVNAYQRYLEMNMRKGYSYKDVIEGHFNTKVRFDELLMPEYIGGVSKDVSMNSIVQTVETQQSGAYAGSLGSMAGNANVIGSPGSSISCYCDEECYIIGILSVSPVPNYSQLLPKHWLHRDLLDSYYPEFDNIGFQPITYKEVCPIQAYNDNPKSLVDTFGYQRAWYDYVSKVDEVHGLFRTNMRNFLINRTFNVKPELSESFLLIDPDQVNDVFSVTESTDKIFGQVWFQTSVQLPISRTSLPKLE